MNFPFTISIDVSLSDIHFESFQNEVSFLWNNDQYLRNLLSTEICTTFNNCCGLIRITINDIDTFNILTAKPIDKSHNYHTPESIILLLQQHISKYEIINVDITNINMLNDNYKYSDKCELIRNISNLFSRYVIGKLKLQTI